MPVFRYQALNVKGQKIKGFAYNKDIKELDDYIKSKHCYLIKAVIHKTPYYAIHRNVKISTLRDFFIDLHRLLERKITFLDAIDVLSSMTTDVAMQIAMCEIHYFIENGMRIFQAFKTCSIPFENFIIQCIRNAEEIGNMSYACKTISAFLDYKIRFIQNRNKILFYPICVFSMIILLLILSLRYVVPNIRSFLDESIQIGMNQRILFFLSDCLLQIPLIVQCICIFAVLSCFYWRKQKKGIRDAGSIYSASLWISWVQMIAMFLKSGITLKDALEFSIQEVNEPSLRQAIQTIIHHVVNGQSLYETLQTMPALPVSVVKFAKLGELGGNLGEMLEESAKFEQNKLNHRIEKIFQYMQPTLLIIAGGMLLWILYTTLIPLYSVIAF